MNDMRRVEAYHILRDMYDEATEEQRAAISIAMDDIEFVDLMPYDMAIAALREQTNTVQRVANTDNVLGGWISVKDRLPEREGQYMVCETWSYGNVISLAYYTPKYDGFEEHLNGRAIWYKCGSEWGDYEVFGVTHWMPLPEPPEVDV